MDAEGAMVVNRGATQRGAVLLLILLVVSAISVTLSVLISISTTERLLASSQREAVELRYAAEAIASLALVEMGSRADWDGVLSGAVVSGFSDSTTAPTLGGSRRVDLGSRASGFGPVEPGAWGADEPRWALYAWGPAASLAPSLVDTPIYVAAWVADDERDGDRNPDHDSNGRLLLRGEAFGTIRGQRAVVLVASRAAPAPVPLRILDWRLP